MSSVLPARNQSKCASNFVKELVLPFKAFSEEAPGSPEFPTVSSVGSYLVTLIRETISAAGGFPLEAMGICGVPSAHSCTTLHRERGDAGIFCCSKPLSLILLRLGRKEGSDYFGFSRPNSATSRSVELLALLGADAFTLYNLAFII